jgi:hypothetical protein
MSENAVLGIGLHRYDLESYMVEFCLNHPKDDAEIRLGQERAARVRFNMQEWKHIRGQFRFRGNTDL